jgi:hypothetical protein
MIKHGLLLIALILGATSLANASVPIINLTDHLDAEENRYWLSTMNSNLPVGKGYESSSGSEANKGAPVLPSGLASRAASAIFSEAVWNVVTISSMIDQKMSVGSFSSIVRQESSSPHYDALDSDVASFNAEFRYGSIPVLPEAPVWAASLLALGCVIYLGRQGRRRRQRLFGFQK